MLQPHRHAPGERGPSMHRRRVLHWRRVLGGESATNHVGVALDGADIIVLGDDQVVVDCGDVLDELGFALLDPDQQRRVPPSLGRGVEDPQLRHLAIVMRGERGGDLLGIAREGPLPSDHARDVIHFAAQVELAEPLAEAGGAGGRIDEDAVPPRAHRQQQRRDRLLAERVQFAQQKPLVHRSLQVVDLQKRQRTREGFVRLESGGELAGQRNRVLLDGVLRGDKRAFLGGLVIALSQHCARRQHVSVVVVDGREVVVRSVDLQGVLRRIEQNMAVRGVFILREMPLVEGREQRVAEESRVDRRQPLALDGGDLHSEALEHEQRVCGEEEGSREQSFFLARRRGVSVHGK